MFDPTAHHIHRFTEEDKFFWGRSKAEKELDGEEGDAEGLEQGIELEKAKSKAMYINNVESTYIPCLCMFVGIPHKNTSAYIPDKYLYHIPNIHLHTSTKPSQGLSSTSTLSGWCTCAGKVSSHRGYYDCGGVSQKWQNLNWH